MLSKPYSGLGGGKRSDTAELGFSMIEVLITIVIMSVGLLGLAAMQTKMATMEMESYQRAQALSLVADMEMRIRGGRGLLTGPLAPVASGGTAIVTVIGPGASSPYDPASAADCVGQTGMAWQICDWALALKGASESKGGISVGAMLGARGCIVSVPPSIAGAVAEYYVVVIWQGLVATADPATGTYANSCASTVANYGTGLRRAAQTRILVPLLE